MLALLLAAQIAGATPAPASVPEVIPVPPAPAAPHSRRLVPGTAAPYDCNQLGRQIAFRGRGGEYRRLDQLPMGGLQYAVVRMIRGCPVPAPVGYHPGYLLPGAADPAAKPEDAPWNRR
jgi:hypothetical protein